MIKYELNDDVRPLTTKMIFYKISEKQKQMNVQSDTNNIRRDKRPFT